MARLVQITSSAALLLSVFSGTPQVRSADAVSPLRVIQVDSAETWIGVRAPDEEPAWLILHLDGLTKVDVASGEVLDVLKTTRDNDGRSHWAERLIAPNGQTFASLADREHLTLARVDDGTTLVEASAMALLKRPSWPVLTYLSEDGSHCFCIHGGNGRSRGQMLLSRIELIPEPQVVATRDVGRFAQEIGVGRGPEGWTVTATSDESPRAPRFLQVFDQELRLKHKQKIGEPWGVKSVITHPEDNQPRALLAWAHHATGHNRWQLVGPGEGNWVTVCSGIHPPQPGYRGILTAAISPDGRWVVTVPYSMQPTLGVWSVPDGVLRREVCLEGGVYGNPELPGHRTIDRIVFSESGEFLTASDAKNAYLLRFRKLVEAPSSQ